MSRVLRAPLLHFLVIGAVMLGTRSWWEGRPGVALASRPQIVLSRADLGRLRDAWTEEYGKPPGPAAEKTLVRDAIDAEVLYREALAAGLDQRDGAVGERLVRLGGFLGEEGPRDREELEREARRLGLDRNDVVIRRHLVEMMRLATARPGPSDVPTDAELQAYLEGHAADFAEPPRVRLTHIYLSADTHGAALARDARDILEDLCRSGAGPDAVGTRGDAFIQGADVGPASPADLDRIFGADFAREVAQAPVAKWVGPVRSSYGLHLLWVRQREEGRLPPLADVRSRVLLRLLAERGARRAQERMRHLRARYDIAVAR